MAASSHDSDAAQARLVLGLSGAATEAELQAAYWALRAHIESRVVASEDPGFVAARTAELQQLTERLALALDVPPDSLPPPQLDWVRPTQSRGWPVWLGVVAFALALAAGLVFWLMRSPGDSSETSPLAAVAHTEPPGRLVFGASASPARFTVLDAEGTRVVRAGVLPSEPVELAPGEYAVWLSALGCDASRQHSIRVESEADVTLAGPECTRTLELVVRSDLTGDVVRIDGESVGGTGPAPHVLEPGDHQVSIEHEGQDVWTARVEVGEDDRVTLHARVSQSDAAARPPGSPPPPTRERPASRAETAAEGAPPQPRPTLGGDGANDGRDSGFSRGDNAEVARDARRAGSRSWHDQVTRRLVSKYDANDSQNLDTTIEIASIPCSEWRAIESQYESGGLQVPMTRLYGFDGSEWVDGALGIERGLRDFTYRRMKECGLK